MLWRALRRARAISHFGASPCTLVLDARYYLVRYLVCIALLVLDWARV